MNRALPLILAAALASPAFAQDDAPAWNLVVSGDQTFLAHGIPETDDGGPTLSCKQGVAGVKAAMWVEKRLATDEPNADGQWVDSEGRPAPWPGELKVASGKARGTFVGQVNPEEMYGGSFVDALVALDSPVLAAFRATGVIQMEAFGEKTDLPPAPKDKVAALLKACG